MTTLLSYFESNPDFFIFSAFVFGLVFGSFLNVVIYRLPKMMERDWRNQCSEMLGLAAPEAGEPFNLLKPGSRCPHCGHPIGPLENIPVLSYLLQRGRCRHCSASISPRYPSIELLTALLSAAVAWHFGPTIQTALILPLTWGLVALAFIDIDHQLLPDSLTLPLLWLGLLASLFHIFVSPAQAIIGAMVGYMTLWTVYMLFKLFTGKEGMGYGDFKLLAMFGVWMGWKALPLVIILSSVVGAVVGIGMIVLRGRDRNIPIPFGPYLAAAGWIALLWGDQLVAGYLRWASPH